MISAFVCYTVFTSHFTASSISFITFNLLISQVDESQNPYETILLHERIQSDGGGGTRPEAGATDTSAAQEGDESTAGVDSTSTTTAPPTNFGEVPNTAPPLPPPRCKGDPVYTEAVVLSGSKTTVPPSATDMVVYDDITAFQNKDVQYEWLIVRAFIIKVVIAFHFRVNCMPYFLT